MLACWQDLIYYSLTQFRVGYIKQKDNVMQNDTLVREQILADNIKMLDSVNRKIAKLLVQKDELTNQIICEFGHNHEGQRSYEYYQWKIEIKTPCIYSLNKKLYETGDYNIPAEFNPIKQSLSYAIDKRLCDESLNTAPSNVRDMLIELIDKKPGKASVTIKERSA